jgi:CubicO group peptidase (beta-lactamase class C family)
VRPSLTLLASTIVAAPLLAQSADFDAYVARGVRDWHVPGLAVAVVQGDSVVFQKAYGVRDVTTNAPFDIHTRSAIGSTTKAMTVVALGMLVDEGKVRWDDRVIDHLPDFRLYDEYVTRDLRVRDLLTHRSGLGGEGDLLWANPDMPEKEIVSRMRFMKPEAPVRTRFIYNNIMYQVAGDIVEQASGMSWERFLTERIFTPLGMRETIATVAASVGQPNVATPHELVRDTLRVISEVSTDQVKAAGSVYSSIADMTRWVQFLLDSGRVGGRRLISDSVFREIFTPQFMADRRLYPALTLAQPHFFTYGFGIFIQDYAGYKLEMHTGSIDGMCALIALVPEKRLGFYILENVDHAELRHALMYKAVDSWLGTGHRDWSAELHALFAAAHEKKVAAPASKAPPSLPLDQYAGTYRDSTFGEIIVSTRSDTLHLQYFSSGATLEHADHDVFTLTHGTRRYMSDEAATFLPDGTGGAAALHVFGVTFARAPLTGIDVVRRMHDRYQATWYSTLSFTELAEQRQPDGTIKKETWWEEGKLPGRLRIDVGTTPTDSIHGHRTVVFANDSAYVRAPGQTPRAAARLNLLLVLGFDVYRQPVERTVAELTAEGFDLSRVHTTTWHGRAAIVVGALAGDTTSNQFWIDSERDVFLRLHQGDLDAWFDDYRPLDGGWIAADVTIQTKGVTTLHEVYAHIKGNVELPDAWFDGRTLLNDPGGVH